MAQPKFTVIKKIGTKTVYGKVSVRDIPQGGALELFSVFGRAVGKKLISTAMGDSIAFAGDFRAINCRGERFMAMTAYLPPQAAAFVSASMKDGEPLEFAFKVSVSDNPDSPVGYQYDVEPIPTGAGGTDPLAHLVAAVTGTKAAELEPPKPRQDAQKPRGKGK